MEELSPLMQLRREKLQKLTEMNIVPYAYIFEQKEHSTDITDNFDKLENSMVSVAGRIMSVRLMGKAAFFDPPGMRLGHPVEHAEAQTKGIVVSG